MFRKLFHKDVFFPSVTIPYVKKLQKDLFKGYVLSQHLEDWLWDDKANRSHSYVRDILIKCLDKLSEEYREVVEVEFSKDYHYFKKRGWFLTKYVCRIPYENGQDIVVVIRPQWDAFNQCYNVNNNLVVTAWLNSSEDDHSTLDASKYCTKEEWCNIMKN